MSVLKRVGIAAALSGAALLSGCISIYEGRSSTCPDGDRNAPNWPYCGSAPPGGSQPADWPEYADAALADETR